MMKSSWTLGWMVLVGACLLTVVFQVTGDETVFKPDQIKSVANMMRHIGVDEKFVKPIEEKWDGHLPHRMTDFKAMLKRCGMNNLQINIVVKFLTDIVKNKSNGKWKDIVAKVGGFAKVPEDKLKMLQEMGPKEIPDHEFVAKVGLSALGLDDKTAEDAAPALTWIAKLKLE